MGRSVGSQIDLRELARSPQENSRRRARFLPVRSNTSSKSSGRPGERRPRHCESCSAARLRAARDRLRPAAIECRDLAGPCRGPSMARPRTPRRTPPRTAAPPRDRPAARGCCCAPLALTVSRSSCTRALAHVGRDDLARDRRPSPPSRSSCRRATRRYRAPSCPVRARRAARRAAMLHPEEKTVPVPASGVRSGLPRVTISPSGA